MIRFDTEQLVDVGEYLFRQQGRRQVVVSRPSWDIYNSALRAESHQRSYDNLFKPIFPPLTSSFTDLVDDFVLKHKNNPPLWLEVMGTVHLLEQLEVPGIAVGIDSEKRTRNLIQLKANLLDHPKTFQRIDDSLHELRPNHPFPNFITWKGEGALMAIPQDAQCFSFYIYNFSLLLDYNGSGYFQVPGRLLSQTTQYLNRVFGDGTGFSIYTNRAQKSFIPYDGLIRIDRHAFKP